MPPPLLTFLKYIFLAVLYLFFLRVLRAVWIELREPRVMAPEPSETSAFAEAFAAAPALRTARPDPAAAMTTASSVVEGARLVITNPAERAGVAYPLRGEMTVGRAPGCGISLPDDTFVSQLHARVFPRDADWWVEDLGSTNGTYLNDGPVSSAAAIRPGDRVQFGQTVAEMYP